MVGDVVALVGAHDVALFNPTETHQRLSKLDAVIAHGQRMKDWPLLKQAIDEKIEEQRQFAMWWDVSVRSAGNPSISADQQKLTLQDAETRSGIRSWQVSRWSKELEDIERYRDRLLLAVKRKAGLEPQENHRAEGTGENEWFTPEIYIEAARKVMGAIDVDPASHEVAQRTVQAARFYMREDDGLAQPWLGRVWLNPPYTQPWIAQFIDKLLAECHAGRATEAIMLTHAYADTRWFHAAAAAADLMCFTRGRVKFIDIDGQDCTPTQGQAFFYFGSKLDRFAEVFRQFGLIAMSEPQ